MRDFDVHRAHAVAVPEPHDEPPAIALHRRVARKAASASTPGDPSTRAALDAFGAAINAGIHPIAREGAGELAPDAASLLASAAGSGGRPLPSDVRRSFEASLGADLSAVRVHDGPTSAAASAAISARAYATGNEIHFAAGQYDPDSQAGRHLLAHEVAHTVQQAGATPSPQAKLQAKLEVSEPGDACELEADRAADAMVAGQAFAISGASGVQRAIQRDPEDEAAGGGGGGGAEPATVHTTWTINYDQVHSGTARLERPRTADTVLHVTHFGIQPASGTVSPATPMAGYNLQPAGRVTMGSRQHPRGQPGEASAAVSYLRRSEVRVQVDGDRAILRAHGGRAALERGVARALEARLRGSVDSGTFDDAGLTQLLPEAARAAGITVTATSREPTREVVNTAPLRYPAIHRDQEMHVSVDVPTAEAVVRGASSDDHEDETTAGEHAGTTTRTETELESETEIATRTLTEIGAAYRRECERFASQAVEWFFSGRLQGEIHGDLRGEGTGSLSQALSSELSLGAILGMIPGLAELAPLVGDAASITSSITPELAATIALTGGGSLEAEALGSRRSTTETSLRQTIARELTARWERELSTRVRVALRVAHGRERAEGTTGGTRTEDRRHTERSYEGHGASQARARPVLTLANEVAGPEVPRGPQRIE